jgi:hypothetical protein
MTPDERSCLSLASHGRRIGIQCDDARLLSGLQERLPPGCRLQTVRRFDRWYALALGRAGAASRKERAVLRVNGEVLAESVDAEGLLDRLVSDLELYVAETARRRAFIHAAVVGWHGVAVVCPGASYCGKTSLAAELVRAGADYYSDEYAVLDDRGRVHPYPRPLSIRGADGSPARRCTAEALGGRRGTRPLPVGLVVSSVYTPGASWQPRRLSPGEAMLALLAHSVSIRRQPAAVLAALARVVSAAPVLAGARGEAAEVVAPILSSVRPRRELPSP